MTPRSGLDQRYLIVLGGCMIQFTVIGLMIGNGLFFKVFEAEFGWSRTTVSVASSLSMFMMGTLAIIAGRLSERFGPRIVLIGSGIVYGLGYVLLSQIDEPWQLYLIFGGLLAMGVSTHDVVTLSVVARWFERRRGIMTGVVKVGTAIGQVCVPPMMALSILWLGWRDAVVVMGITATILVVIAAMAMKMPPDPGGAGARAAREGISFAEARAGPIFWRICLIQFLFFPTLTTIPLHIIPHGTDMGLSQPAAAFLVSIFGGVSVAGRLTVGTFADRIGGRNAYMMCFIPLIFSLTALLFVDVPWLLYAVIGVYGFAHGGFFTVVSPTIAEYFGMRAHASIFGIVLFCGTFGGAISPILAGWVFDTTGGYFWAFATLAAMGVTGLGLVLSLPRPRAVVVA